jgi:hypothetical protein
MKMGRRSGSCRAAAGSRIDSDMLLRRALPAAHFDRNAAIPFTDLVHLGMHPFVPMFRPYVDILRP